MMFNTGSASNTALLAIILVGVAGIVAWHLIPKRRATARMLSQICFFTVMSGLLISARLVPYEPTQAGADAVYVLFAGIAKALWWIHLAWAVIGFVRIYLVIERKPREARLLQDLVVGVVYVAIVLSILAFVFSLPVGTLIATSGLLAIVLGLALQNTLSDLFSGIALNLGRPYALGDWIVLGDGTEGRVVETDWRSTHLATLAHNVIALPNSFLAKIGITNISRPDASHGLSITVRMASTAMPAAVADVMRSALLSCNSIQQEPPPVVIIRNLDSTAVELELSYRVADIDRRITASNEIFDLVYRHARFAGLRLAPPKSQILANGPVDDQAATPLNLISSVPIFAALNGDEHEALAAGTSTRTYRDGEVIAEQGETLQSLMVIRTGVVTRQRNAGDSAEREVDRLAPGDVIGETGLLASMGEPAKLRALGPVSVYVIDQDDLAPLLAKRPGMAEDLAAILSGRIPTAAEADPDLQPAVHTRFAILKAIRRSLGLRPGMPNSFDVNGERG
jgi:small-conductance mechanosensitive channel/CRP-like cAMP-binding protein